MKKNARYATRLFSTALLLVAVMPAVAQTVTGFVKEQCAVCHNLTGPSPETLAELQQRKGPDLYYAGNKYREQWLVEWLQEPKRIRPAGMFYGNHIRTSESGDVVDGSTLVSHMKLDETQAKDVAKVLMSMKGKSELIKGGSYRDGKISVSMGEMMFDKFRGCMACHEIEPGYGGSSGPEVYTVAERLQADYLISFMRNPVAWDKRTMMPRRPLKESDLQKFVHYFRALAKVK